MKASFQAQRSHRCSRSRLTFPPALPLLIYIYYTIPLFLVLFFLLFSSTRCFCEYGRDEHPYPHYIDDL